MPSPPSPRRRPPRGKAARAASAIPATPAVAGIAALAVLLFVSACSTAPAPAPLPREVAPHGVAEAERGYLLDPLEGYPAAAKSATVAERRERIARVERALVEE